jgi:hypothetical protein
MRFPNRFLLARDRLDQCPLVVAADVVVLDVEEAVGT